MNKEKLKEIGERIRALRYALGLTREKAAELADITVGFWGQLEVGTSQMSIDTLMKVAKTLNVSMDYIVNGEPYGETEAAKISRNKIDHLLSGRTERELRLVEEVLMMFLMKQ